jgi:cell division protein FtsI/penicillin-binding protein 2
MYDRVRMPLTFGLRTVLPATILFAIAAGGTARGNELGVRLETLRLADGQVYVAALADGGRAELTLDPRLQEATEEVLRAFQVPYGGAAVVSVPDGRVLALVGRSAADPRLGPSELALRAWAPAASVFKVVSATALVERGVSPSTRTCYHAGTSAVLLDNLLDLPSLDTRCDTLAYGLGKSQNAILAKLASKHLTPTGLEDVGRALGFGRAIAFELPVEPSRLDVPTDPLEFARTAAGFWHSTLSPFHGALLAATIANGGAMPAPTIVERAVAKGGMPVALALPEPTRAVPAAAAREVGRMMELTTRIGTAKGMFRDRRGRRILPIEVAGKTGTLSAMTDHGYVGYSWFIGYAPADHPAIAFAVALGNGPRYRIKASYVGRRIVTEYLKTRARGTTKELVAAR